jgi:hypothetical protein
VRFVAEQPSLPGSVPLEPTLEDAYLLTRLESNAAA